MVRSFYNAFAFFSIDGIFLKLFSVSWLFFLVKFFVNPNQFGPKPGPLSPSFRAICPKFHVHSELRKSSEKNLPLIATELLFHSDIYQKDDNFHIARTPVKKEGLWQTYSFNPYPAE